MSLIDGLLMKLSKNGFFGNLKSDKVSPIDQAQSNQVMFILKKGLLIFSL